MVSRRTKASGKLRLDRIGLASLSTHLELPLLPSCRKRSGKVDHVHVVFREKFSPGWWWGWMLTLLYYSLPLFHSLSLPLTHALVLYPCKLCVWESDLIQTGFEMRMFEGRRRNTGGNGLLSFLCIAYPRYRDIGIDPCCGRSREPAHFLPFVMGRAVVVVAHSSCSSCRRRLSFYKAIAYGRRRPQ